MNNGIGFITLNNSSRVSDTKLTDETKYKEGNIRMEYKFDIVHNKYGTSNMFTNIAIKQMF